jgi:hypothetical protein
VERGIRSLLLLLITSAYLSVLVGAEPQVGVTEAVYKNGEWSSGQPVALDKLKFETAYMDKDGNWAIALPGSQITKIAEGSRFRGNWLGPGFDPGKVYELTAPPDFWQESKSTSELVLYANSHWGYERDNPTAPWQQRNFHELRAEQYRKWCGTVIPPVTQRQTIHGEPSYFSKPAATSDQVFLIGSTNLALDMATGAMTQVPGYMDPVPTPDEQLLLVPGNGMQFYAKDQNGQYTVKAMEDSTLSGNYQSAGETEPEGDSKYRVLAGTGSSLQIRDYRWQPLQNGYRQLQTVGEAWRPCPDLTLTLPMLSKNGTHLAGVNEATHHTSVYSIADGKCTLVKEFPFSTGKVDFSFDGDGLAFHVFNDSAATEKTFESPTDHWVGNIYTYSFKKGELVQQTYNTVGNSVYPGYKKNGQINFMTYSKRIDGQPRQVTFQTIDPNQATNSLKLPEKPIDKTASAETQRKWQARQALGYLWSKVCNQSPDLTDPSHAAIKAMGLDRTSCEALVRVYWGGYRQPIVDRLASHAGKTHLDAEMPEKLTRSDLLAACPQGEHAVGDLTSVAPAGTASVNHAMHTKGVDPTKKKGKFLFALRKCVACHSGKNYDDPTKLTAETKEKILIRVKGEGIQPWQRMPQSGPLLDKPDDWDQFASYLNGTSPLSSDERAYVRDTRYASTETYTDSSQGKPTEHREEGGTR